MRLCCCAEDTGHVTTPPASVPVTPATVRKGKAGWGGCVTNGPSDELICRVVRVGVPGVTGGPGCSYQLCHSPQAWFGDVLDLHVGHVECAGVGDCNYSTGSCV